MTPEQIAARFGCTVEQAKAHMQRNAQGLRKMSDRQVKRSGFSRTELNEKAAGYEARTK